MKNLKRKRQTEVGMNRVQKQINEEAIQRQERRRARGLELAKGLGVAGEEALLRLCADGQSEASARGVAALALGFLGYKPAVPILLELANNNDLSVVVNATRALEMIPSAETVLPMLSLAKDATRVEVRNRAIDVLGTLGDNQAEETLVSILCDHAEAETTRCCAAAAIGGLLQHSDVATARLLDVLKEPSAILRWTALNTLGIMGDESAIPAIQACLSDGEIVPHLPSETTVASAAENALRNLKVCAQPAS
jgi:HEAT repeat protein